MSGLPEQVYLCPVCSCPIQKLMGDSHGGTRGTLEDALAEHARVVHPGETE